MNCYTPVVTKIHHEGLFRPGWLRTLSLSLFLVTPATQAGWSALGTGVDNAVYALTTDSSGNLYAGGNFATAGGTSGSRIAKWNGSNWSAVGTGTTNATVYALGVSGSNVYAGGQFTTIGGVTTNHIAKWNGSRWSPLGTGTTAMVSTLVLDSSGNLYAGGNFTSASGVANTTHIAKWNGSSWSALGTGLNEWVRALAFDSSGKLYAGGHFTDTSGGCCLADWNGSSWNGGTFMNGDVKALAINGSNWYIGGDFTSYSLSAANHVTGQFGSSVGTTGVGGSVYALALDSHNNLYVGGNFTTAGGATANYIAKWNGSQWSTLGTGMNQYIQALTVDSSGNLYAGGYFTTADGVSASYIAKWDYTTTTTLTSSSNPSNYGNTVTFTATVKPVTATGTVVFKDGTTTLGTATLDGGLATSSGSATLPLNNLTGGSHVLTASYSGDTDYSSSTSGRLTQTIGQSSQTITFNALPAKTMGEPPFALTATASSGLTVTYTATGQCTVSGTTVTLTSAGTCDLTAQQAGDSNYSSATAVPRTLTINTAATTQASQTITFNTLPAKTVGDAPFTLTATASSGLTVTYTATGNCSVSENTVTLTSAGTCDITAHQAGNTNYSPAPEVTQTLTINNATTTTQATQTITFDALPAKTLGEAPFALTATASSGLTVTYTATGNCSISDNKVTLTTAGTCDITAHQVGDSNYLPAAEVTQTLTINAATQTTQTITFDALPAKALGDVPLTLTATASSGLAVTYTATGNCSVSENIVTLTTAGTCDIIAHQAGDSNYLPAPEVTQTLTIHPALSPHLTINISGRGKVKSSNVLCSSSCSSSYPQDTVITLQAYPRPSWTFTSWSGDCDSHGQVTLTTDKTCQVTFVDDQNIPNQRDGNGDGEKDAYQDNVVSLPDKITGNYLTVEVDKACTIDTMSTETMDKVTGYDKKYQFPQGLLYFDILCPKTQVTFYYHGINKIIRRYILQKYGPKIPGDMSTLGWYPIPNVIFDTVKVGSETVMRATYSLTDGEFGDNTGVDGHIVDPAGVAAVE